LYQDGVPDKGGRLLLWNATLPAAPIALEYAWDVWTFSSPAQVVITGGLPQGNIPINSSPQMPIQVWDLSTGHQRQLPGWNPSKVAAINVLPDGRIMAIEASTDPSLKIWDLLNQSEICTLAAARDPAVISGDGRSIAALCDQGTRVWDLPGGKQ